MTRRLSAAARRAQLVETAIGIAEDSGVASIRLRDVATKADVSLGTLHHFFPSKSELMTSVARALTDQLSAAVTSADWFDTWGVRGVEGLNQLMSMSLSALWQTVEQTPNRQLVTYEMTTYALRAGDETDVAGIARQQYADNTTEVAQMLAAMAEVTGTRWTVPLDHLAPLVLTFIDGMVLRWLVDHDAATAETMRAMVARFIESLAVIDESAALDADDTLSPQSPAEGGLGPTIGSDPDDSYL